ncbi:MAG: ABC transporter substrate-binding protein [bacterium]
MKKKCCFVSVILVLILICSNGLSYSIEKDADNHVYRRIFINNPISLDPKKLEGTFSMHLVLQMAESLLSIEKNRIAPAVAKRWEISKDLLEYTFYLDQTSKFDNGQQITAKDVVNTYKYLLSKDSLLLQELSVIEGAIDYIKGSSNEVKGIVALSSNIVKIKLIKPFASFLEMIASPLFAIYPKSSLTLLNEKKVVPVVSSGPYKLVNYLPDKTIVLEKNRFYRNADSVYYDKIIYSKVKSKEKALVSFEQLKYDDIWPYFVKELPISINSHFKKIPVTNPMITYIGFNLYKPIVNRISFRKFIAKNIAVEGYLSKLGLPSHYKSNRFIPRGVIGFREIPFDKNYNVKEDSLELLQKSGCTITKKCVLELIYEKDDLEALEILFEPLKKYNSYVELHLKFIPRIPWYDSFIKQEYSMIYLSYVPRYYSPHSVVTYLLDDAYYPGLKRENIKVLIEQTQHVKDKSLIASLYQQVDDDLCKQYVVIPLYHGNVPYFYVSKDIIGYEQPVYDAALLKIKDLKPNNIQNEN